MTVFLKANESIINKLTHEGVVSNDLLVLINNLTLEDLIAQKEAAGR